LNEDSTKEALNKNKTLKELLEEKVMASLMLNEEYRFFYLVKIFIEKIESKFFEISMGMVFNTFKEFKLKNKASKDDSELNLGLEMKNNNYNNFKVNFSSITADIHANNDNNHNSNNLNPQNTKEKVFSEKKQKIDYKRNKKELILDKVQKVSDNSKMIDYLKKRSFSQHNLQNNNTSKRNSLENLHKNIPNAFLIEKVDKSAEKDKEKERVGRIDKVKNKKEIKMAN